MRKCSSWNQCWMHCPGSTSCLQVSSVLTLTVVSMTFDPNITISGPKQSFQPFSKKTSLSSSMAMIAFQAWAWQIWPLFLPNSNQLVIIKSVLTFLSLIIIKVIFLDALGFSRKERLKIIAGYESDSVTRSIQRIADVLKQSKQDHFQMLEHVGEIYYMTKTTGLELAESDDFSKMILVKRKMILDHMYYKYEKALDKITKWISNTRRICNIFLNTLEYVYQKMHFYALEFWLSHFLLQIGWRKTTVRINLELFFVQTLTVI